MRFLRGMGDELASTGGRPVLLRSTEYLLLLSLIANGDIISSKDFENLFVNIGLDFVPGTEGVGVTEIFRMDNFRMLLDDVLPIGISSSSSLYE